MRIDAATFGRYIERLQVEVGIVASVFKEKGANRFSRPLLIGGLAIFGSYFLVYAPPIKKRAAMERSLAAAKDSAKYADEYKILRDQLNAAYADLPPVKGRDSWLAGAVNDAMRAENLVAESIMPPEDLDQQGFIQQKVTVTMLVKFAEVLSLVNRIEHTKPLLHISNLELDKRKEQLGYNMVTCSVSTLMPSQKAP